MVSIKFADMEVTKEAIGFIAGRFSARIFKTGEVFVPEEALAALAERNFSFTVLNKSVTDPGPTWKRV